MPVGALALAIGVVAAVTCGGESEAVPSSPAHPESSITPDPNATEAPTPLFAGTPPPARFEKQGGGPEPVLEGPASRFALSLDDLEPGTETEREATFEIGTDGVLVPYFRTTQEAAERLGAWGFQGGFTTGYNPLGLLAGVLLGRYYTVTETYLFATNAGAEQAYHHIAGTLRARAASEEFDMRPVGNRSSAVRLALGVVENSQTPAIYHRAVFRRGNLVGVVQTYGAASLMQDATVGDLAALMDAKALGTRPAPVPTPLP